MSPDLRLAIEAARVGGEVAGRAFQGAKQVEAKEGGKGLVTETDKAAEEAIIGVLQSRSSYSIVGEESGRTPGSSDLYWVVDPIDGTTNFARGLPLFVTAIALMRGTDILLGVTYFPVSGQMFYAEEGKGAFVDETAIRVSPRPAEACATFSLDHGYQRDDRKRFATILDRLSTEYSIRTLGATALGVCYVANGTVDAFACSGDELWDFAAGIRIVEEAGGKVTDWTGRPWDGTNSFIFASNGFLHPELLPKLADLQEDALRQS